MRAIILMVAVVACSSAAAEPRMRFIPAPETAPLIVDLHQWSGDEKGSFGSDARLDEAIEARGWNYVRPYLGSNRTPDGCCSEAALARLNAAIGHAISNGTVDEGRIYIVGASGGGYAGLCAYMQGKIRATYNLWVPISDLTAWRRQTRGKRYAKDIEACTRGDPDEMRSRSPLYMTAPETFHPLTIYTGVEDGWNGSVPITHSINMFNRLAREMGKAGSSISAETTLRLLEMRDSDINDDDVAGREIHLRAQAGPVSLVVFEGDHEGLTEQVLRDIDLSSAIAEAVGYGTSGTR